MSFRESVSMSCEGFCSGLSFDMLAAEIGINLGVKALTVCLADIFLSAAADDNFGLEAQYFQLCCQGCHTSKFES